MTARAYGHFTRHSDYPSFRTTRHSELPVIPNYPSFRRKPESIALSVIPNYPSFRRKPESIAPSVIPNYPSFRRKPESIAFAALFIRISCPIGPRNRSRNGARQFRHFPPIGICPHALGFKP